MAGIIVVDKNNFDSEVLRSEKPVFVGFWAPWCSPCTAMIPMMNEIAAEYENKLSFTKINIDENEDLSKKYHVDTIPTMAVFKKGKIGKLLVGALTKNKIIEFIEEQL